MIGVGADGSLANFSLENDKCVTMNSELSTQGSLRSAGCLLLAALLVCGCGKENPAATESPTPTSEVATVPTTGKALAAITCTLCHTLPSPAQLPPEEWPYLLAWMGVYVGYRPDIHIDPNLISKCFEPAEPRVSRAQFDAIRRYYMEESVAQYKTPALQQKPPVSPLFEPIPVEVPASVISMAEIDPVDHSLIIGTSHPANLLVLQNGMITTNSVPSEPVTFERIGPIRRVALMGNLAYDAREGSVVDFDTRDGARQTLVEGYPRIADHCTADIDGDGHDDMVVCGFGNYPVGRVAIWWGGGEKPREQVLFEESGAVWCGVADLDGDGRKDVVIAVGSNRPRIIAFVNQGSRRFEQRTIVERPVGWGYNRCLLVDWDGDGKKDIVEVAGNNIELRGRPLKPWHGLRVLHNDGDWHFHEVLFEPIPGATDVAAGDFDGDGRVDLAVTAFCPDWRDPFPTTVVLLMHQPDGTVQRFGIDDRYWNRWLRVSAGDTEGDGRTDLVLGAAEMPVALPVEQFAHYQQLLQQKASVLLLRNRRAH